MSAASGGEASLAKIVSHILHSHLLVDNPNELNQVNVEYFSKDHNRHIDLLDFAGFINGKYTVGAEMDGMTRQFVRVVATEVDIWKKMRGEYLLRMTRRF